MAIIPDPEESAFGYSHLARDDLKAVSQHFHDLAAELRTTLPPCDHRALALWKLLEAKDAAVRAVALGR